jgi:hypothetical protein
MCNIDGTIEDFDFRKVATIHIDTKTGSLINQHSVWCFHNEALEIGRALLESSCTRSMCLKQVNWPVVEKRSF